ncbi:MAG TPA: GAF domain-containing protein [Candidatus Udaeobacter sp.]|nr:GAF domain-containing protein [Candidatus Udaeobacter sp.]
MKTIGVNVTACIERLRLETGSDFATLGLIDTGKRKLCWSYAAGSMSERTLLVEQKPTAGLSGIAIRSGRTASTGAALTDKERFEMEEPVLLTEQLRIAASMPLVMPNGIAGVLLIGRRSADCYAADELEKAFSLTKELATILL